MDDQAYLVAILEPLVENKAAIRIDRTTDERGVLLSVSLAQEDMGRIIGKQGDTARAIRRLVRQFGFASKSRVAVKINEPGGSIKDLEEDLAFDRDNL